MFEMFAKSIVIIMLIFNGNFLRQVLDCIIYFFVLLMFPGYQF